MIFRRIPMRIGGRACEKTAGQATERPAEIVDAGREAIAAYAMVGFEGDAGFDRGAAAQLRG